MMGPETTTGASAAGAEGAAAAGEAVGAGGVAALTVDVGAAEPLSPQAASERIATAAPQQRIKLRILGPNPFFPTRANTKLCRTAKAPAGGKSRTRRDTSRRELCRGLPFRREWHHRHCAKRCERKTRGFRERLRLWD